MAGQRVTDRSVIGETCVLGRQNTLQHLVQVLNTAVSTGQNHNAGCASTLHIAIGSANGAQQHECVIRLRSGAQLVNRDASILQTISVTNVTHGAVTTVRQYSTNQQTGNSTNNTHLHRAKSRGRSRNLSLAHHATTGGGSQLNLSATVLQLREQTRTVVITLEGRNLLINLVQSRINAALQRLGTNLQVCVRHSVSVTCSFRAVGAGHLNIQNSSLGGTGHLDGVHEAAGQLSLREGIAISNQSLSRVLRNLTRGRNARLGRNIHLRGVSATGTGGINHQRVNNQRSLRSVLAIGHVAVDGTRHSENHNRQQNQQTVSENATYLAAKGNRGGMRGVIHEDILEEEKRTLNIGEKL